MVKGHVRLVQLGFQKSKSLAPPFDSLKHAPSSSRRRAAGSAVMYGSITRRRGDLQKARQQRNHFDASRVG
jgi:hypothetical protein